ncbi:hypothetical protein JB92DRAFT_90312 [Gautieria morchelliformis]|nr:hypothetical protein JB92DRAFT_90312 [Gautieria morchelliformis]
MPELLSDGDSHKAHRAKTHRTSSHRRHRSRPSQERELDVTADATLRQARQLSRLLAHDEFEAVGLRRVLSQTAERLEQESRRAAEAETRAREADARVLALQAARHLAQAEAQREKEALKAHQAQLEVARNEILRAQRELDSMAADKERAEQDAARERSRARAVAKEVEIQRARELGREEGKTQGYLDGRKEGWHLGTQRGIKEAYREMIYYDDASIDSRSLTPPLTSQLHRRSSQSTVTRPAAPRPGSVAAPLPDIVSEPRQSLRTAPSNISRRRSGSVVQSWKSHIRVNSDPKPPTVTADPIHDAPSTHHSERVEPIARPASSRLSPSASRERISPVPVQNRPSTPRHSANSPLPEGYIPLQENGRVSLPPPHGVDLPPPSPHTPTIPLPMLVNDLPQQSLHPTTPTANAAPTITVQEPTPPEPPMSMPEPHPAPAESPPLPALPTSGMERPNKGKQRQRMGPPRAGTGLHAPGRSSPSDTSTEFSQFEIVEQPERVRGLGLGRSNTSKLSIIMEGGSTVAESPEPERFPTPQVRGVPPTRNIPSRGPPAIPSQGILDDPREYAEFSPPLSPAQLAHRRLVAEQLRYSPLAENRDHARSTRDDVSIRSSTTRASGPRRRPNPTMPERLAASRDVAVLEKQAEMYDAFGTGRAFPTFDSQSSPEDGAVPAREFTKSHRRMSTATTVPEITIQPPSRPSSKGSKASAIGNRVSSESMGPAPTSPVPFRPPSRPPSRRHSVQGSPLSPSRIPLPLTSGHVPMSLGTPHSADMDLPPGFVPTQGPPMTPSRVPLPHTVGQIPMSLNTPASGDFGLPPGFIPTQGPPEILEAFSSGALPKTPGLGAPGLPSRTPHLNPATLPSLGLPSGFQGHTPSGIPLPLSTATTVRGLPAFRTPHVNRATLPSLGLPSGFQGHTPSGIPLPLSTATTFRGLPNDTSPVPRGSGRSSYQDLPRATAPMYEAATLPQNFKYPSTPARMPLPESVAGSPRGSTSQTPFLDWGNSLADGAPGPSMSATLGRPMSLYSGDAGPNKKCST